MKVKGAVPKKIVFYEIERIKKFYSSTTTQSYNNYSKVETWHRYADVLIPLLSLPTLVFIGVCLHNYVMDPSQQRDPSKWKIFALSGALLLISFAVFCYLCIRLNNPVLSFGKRRFKTNFSLIRSASSGCFMKSVNSDLQFMVPFNNYPPTYESIIFDVPPSYTIVTSESTNSLYKKPSTSCAPLKIVEV